jgi:hypothetical protein
MPFKLTWTGQSGLDEMVAPTATDALREIALRSETAADMVVTDDHGNAVQLAQLVVLAGGGALGAL